MQPPDTEPAMLAMPLASSPMATMAPTGRGAEHVWDDGAHRDATAFGAPRDDGLQNVEVDVVHGMRCAALAEGRVSG